MPPSVAEARKPAPLPEPEPELGTKPVFGKPFVGPGGVTYSYGEKSVRGDPYWMSKSAPLAGKSRSEAAELLCGLDGAGAGGGESAGRVWLFSVVVGRWENRALCGVCAAAGWEDRAGGGGAESGGSRAGGGAR